MDEDRLSHSKELPFYPKSTENNSEVFTLEERCDHICIFENAFSLPFSECISLQRAGTARSCPVILTYYTSAGEGRREANTQLSGLWEQKGLGTNLGHLSGQFGRGQ